MERPALLMLYVCIVPWRSSFDVKITTSQKYLYAYAKFEDHDSLALVKLPYRLDTVFLVVIHAHMVNIADTPLALLASINIFPMYSTP